MVIEIVTSVLLNHVLFIQMRCEEVLKTSRRVTSYLTSITQIVLEVNGNTLNSWFIRFHLDIISSLIVILQNQSVLVAASMDKTMSTLNLKTNLSATKNCWASLCLRLCTRLYIY